MEFLQEERMFVDEGGEIMLSKTSKMLLGGQHCCTGRWTAPNELNGRRARQSPNGWAALSEVDCRRWAVTKDTAARAEHGGHVNWLKKLRLDSSFLLLRACNCLRS